MYVRERDYLYTDSDNLYYAPTQWNNARAGPNPLMQAANDINCKCSSCPVYFIFYLFFIYLFYFIYLFILFCFYSV